MLKGLKDGLYAAGYLLVKATVHGVHQGSGQIGLFMYDMWHEAQHLSRR